MARGLFVRREGSNGQFAERPYEVQANKIVLLINLDIKIPYEPSANAFEVVENYERNTWSHLNGPLEISEFESLSGTYLPAIARPLGLHNESMTNPRAADENEIAKSYLREHNTIADDIERCFDVVSPSLQNYEAFGTQFEKITYFACVGIESLFNKILSDNGLGRRNATMREFVTLKPLLRIDEYTISLPHYPWLPQLRPFDGWREDRPSASLSWFNAYNSLKHDKQNSQQKATMRNALNAASAYYALTFAVFGNQMFSGYIGERFFFQIAKTPAWTIDERYFRSIDGTWSARGVTLPLPV